MRKAICTIPDSTNYHKAAWIKGLKTCGFEIVRDYNTPTKDDLLLIWNVSARDKNHIKLFKDVGATILVAENGYLGKQWGGHKWFALSRDHHNGAGTYPSHLGPSRVAKYSFECKPWREGGVEFVALPQRGIGEVGIAMPRDYKFPNKCRIRPHLGLQEIIPVEQDIQNARAVVTWGSGAAIKAMAMGIPVFYGFNDWIAKDGATPISQADWKNPQRPDRTKAFENVFSAMWTIQEVESGIAFKEFM